MSDQLCTRKLLEAAFGLLTKALRFGFKEASLEMADGAGGGGFDGMVGCRVEELVGPRVADGSSECCICVPGSSGMEYRGETLYRTDKRD